MLWDKDNQTWHDKFAHRRLRHGPRVEALQKLPGVGHLTAMMLVAEIGDIERFATARKLCAWAGLTPTVRNSDRTVHHGHITKQGSTWVRWALIERTRLEGLLRTLAVLAHLLEDVKAASEQLAGDRNGRDVLAASLHDLRVGAGEWRARLGDLRCLNYPTCA